jgi:hypothetical protein
LTISPSLATIIARTMSNLPASIPSIHPQASTPEAARETSSVFPQTLPHGVGHSKCRSLEKIP